MMLQHTGLVKSSVYVPNVQSFLVQNYLSVIIPLLQLSEETCKGETGSIVPKWQITGIYQ